MDIRKSWTFYEQDLSTFKRLFRNRLKVSNSRINFCWNSIAQKLTEIFWRNSALASKMEQIKKKWRHFIMLNTPLLVYMIKCVIFFIWPILVAWAEILQNFQSLSGQWCFKTNYFEIYWPFKVALWVEKISTYLLSLLK